ncbi:MAG: aromatic acid exporter family protein [Clostridia bacterium]
MKKLNIEHSVLPGLRIIKTIVALVIVMIMSICSNGVLAPYDMAVVAILAMQDDVAKSFKEVKNRIGSTIIGGIIGTIAMVIGYITNESILKLLMVPLGIFFILYLCSKLINRTEFIIIACYVFLSITLEEAPEISWIYPIKIMITTIVASIVAMIVNLYDPRKKQRVRVYNEKNK